MSTRSTIRYDVEDDTQTGFHLYSDAFDEENEYVYLELDGFHFEASSIPDLTWTDHIRPRLTVKLPYDWAKRLKLIE